MGDGSSVASANSPRSVPSSGVPIRRFHRLKDAAGLRMRPIFCRLLLTVARLSAASLNDYAEFWVQIVSLPTQP